MTVLVTGATGFLGSHIAEILVRSGARVRALVRPTSDTRFLRSLPNVELCHGSVEDRASLVKAAEGVAAVVHSAGLVKARTAEEFYRVNEGGTENALFAAASSGPKLRRFVLVSSMTAVGPSDTLGNPVSLNAVPRPITTYGKSKLLAEERALAYKDRLHVVMVRPPTIYGPRDREVLIFFKSVKNRILPLTNPPGSKLSIIYGPDCAAAVVKALEADVPSGSRYFVDDGQVYTFADMIHAVERAVGRKAWVRIPLPRRVVLAAATASELYGRASGRAMMFTREKCNDLFSQWVCDSRETRQALGWEPKVPFSIGVKLTVDWYRQAGWL